MEHAWVYLQTTVHDWEADVIAGLLETNNIPVLRKYPGNSGVAKIYLGSAFGVELYVPANQLELARTLLLQVQQNTEKE
ncbi:MAG: DUF2007 domain-containing protein [Clostridia bacterium]|nr:DUF2007 domain-containing protein [Clostridia bacterium]